MPRCAGGPHGASLDAERDVAAGRRCGARLVIPGDPAGADRSGRPGALAPFALWVRGAPPAAPRAVALVGARASTTYGERVTVDLAVELARRGWAVVSGGAYGIDAAGAPRRAHGRGPDPGRARRGRRPRLPGGQRAAAGGGRPRGGSLVSEVPRGATPSRSRFLQRNRLIAAISVPPSWWRRHGARVPSARPTTRDVCCAPWVRCGPRHLGGVGGLPPPAARRGRRVRHGRGEGHRARRARGTRSGARAGRGCGTRHGRPRPLAGRCTTGCRAGPRATPRRSPRAPGRRSPRLVRCSGLELEGLARGCFRWVVGDAHE
ncbi:DNA-processing protein DprA [Cellulomonas phragmiteti]|uniref:DNA-processing protein DprA n=1 Tax=Cellulomonas phragmiteti TaxID=478780 RepID=UPI00363A2F85